MHADAAVRRSRCPLVHALARFCATVFFFVIHLAVPRHSYHNEKAIVRAAPICQCGFSLRFGGRVPELSFFSLMDSSCPTQRLTAFSRSPCAPRANPRAMRSCLFPCLLLPVAEFAARARSLHLRPITVRFSSLPGRLFPRLIQGFKIKRSAAIYLVMKTLFCFFFMTATSATGKSQKSLGPSFSEDDAMRNVDTLLRVPPLSLSPPFFFPSGRSAFSIRSTNDHFMSPIF